MTDDTDRQSVGHDQTKSPIISTQADTDIQLQYPQIYLEASLQSLITHSFTSSPSASTETVTTMRHLNVPTDGSFIHVDEDGIEEDARSEITDTSLTSGSNLDGLHTTSSDEEEEDNERYVTLRDNATQDEQTIQEPGDESAPVGLAASTPVLGQAGPVRRPLCILSISCAATVETKDEALRKVGSVWTRPSLLSKSTSTHYHIVPSEFTMDWQSGTSDLIEISAQMIVFEGRLSRATTPGSSPDRPRLTLTDGTPVEINQVNKMKIHDSDGSLCSLDLVLVLTSNKDDSEFRDYLDQFIPAISNHTTPLVVQQEEGHNSGYAVTNLKTLCNLDPESATLFIQDFLRGRAQTDDEEDGLMDLSSDSNQLEGRADSNNVSQESATAFSNAPVNKLRPPHEFQMVSATYIDYFRSHWFAVSVGILSLWAGCIVTSLFLVPDALSIGSTSAARADMVCSKSQSETMLPATATAALANVFTSSAAPRPSASFATGIENLVQQLLTPSEVSVAAGVALSNAKKQHNRDKTSALHLYSAKCTKGMLARKGSTFVLPSDVPFDENYPQVTVVAVRRGPHNISTTELRTAHDGLEIEIPRSELYGSIDVVLSRPADDKRPLCVAIDLQESTTKTIISAIHRRYSDVMAGRSHHANNTELLLRIQKSNRTDDGLLEQIKVLASRSAQVVQEMMATAIGGRFQAYHPDILHCVNHQVASYRKALSNTGRHASEKAKRMIDQTVFEFHKFHTKIEQTAPKLRKEFVSKMQWSKSFHRIDKAQKRAKTLVGRKQGKKAHL